VKRILIITLVIVVLAAGAIGAFVYKVTVGWPIYESKIPDLALSEDRKNIVVFSKTNGYRHGSGIDGAKEYFRKLGEEKGWNVLFSENGALHTPGVLEQTDLLIWNNVTGKVLLEEQRAAMRNYIENGGSFMGLHGAGDFSHHWPWYEETLIGAAFSHHTMNPQLQEGTVYPEGGDGGSADAWVTREEWYMFYETPRMHQDIKVLWNLDESDIQPSGNLGFLVKDKDWGMGEDHPIIWRRKVGKGKSVYSAFGHDETTYNHQKYQEILEDIIKWALR
jgi:type 1 glutamine amidotransferase